MAKNETGKNKKVVSKLTSAEKKAKQSEVRRQRNVARKTAIKTAVKKVHTALEVSDVAAAKDLLSAAQSKLSRAKGKGVLHKNTVARKMSRLAKKVALATRRTTADKGNK